MVKLMNFFLKMKKHFNSRVFTSMLKSIIIVLAIPIIINIMVAIVSLASISREMERYERNVLEKAVTEIEQSYAEAFRIMNWVKNNEIVIEYAKSETRNFWNEYQLNQLLEDTASSYSMIDLVYFYFPEYNYVISNLSSGEGVFFNERNYSSSYERWQELMDAEWRGKRGMLEGRNGSRANLIVSSILSGTEHSGKMVLAIQLDGEKMEQKLNGYKLNHEDEIIVINQDDMIYSTHGDDLGMEEMEAVRAAKDEKKVTLNDETYLIRQLQTGQNELRLLYLENSGRKGSIITFNWVFVSATVVFYIILSFFLSFFITKKNYMPIQKIFSLLKDEGQEPQLNDYETMEYYVRNHIFRNKNMTNTLKQYENDLKTVYIERILHGKILYLDSIREGAAMYDLQFQEGVSILALYYIGVGEEEEEEGPNRRELLDELIKEYITSVKQYYLLMEDDYFVAVYHSMAENEVEFSNAIQNENRVMMHYLEREEHLTCELFLSRTFHQLDEMFGVYTEVRNNRMKQENKDIIAEVEEEKQCSIERILELIKENMQNSNFSGADIADAFNITQSHLSRYFKQQMGIGLLDYIHKYRVNMAKEMLRRNSNVRIKEVAEQTGFYNVSAFIRVFKKIEGITPGEYRNEL